MDITIADLISLLPLLITTGTAVAAMTTIGIKRDYGLTASITIAGLLLATLSAAYLMPSANFQVTPLMIVDQYSLFFTVYSLLFTVYQFTVYGLQLTVHSFWA